MAAATGQASWAKGARGEVHVGRLLEELAPEYGVWHDLTFPESAANLDHLVIGPNGVFAVNTKNHSGGRVTVYPNAVWVNGREHDYGRAVRREAATTKQVLGSDAWVTPMLVVLADRFEVKGEPRGVAVCRAEDVVRVVRDHPGHLTTEAQRRLRSRAVEWASASVGAAPPRRTRVLQSSPIVPTELVVAAIALAGLLVAGALVAQGATLSAIVALGMAIGVLKLVVDRR